MSTKIITGLTAAALVLVGCSGSDEPDYDAFVADVNEVALEQVVVDDSNRSEMEDAANTTCLVLWNSRANAAQIIQISFMTSPEDADELVDSLQVNVCSKLSEEDL